MKLATCRFKGRERIAAIYGRDNKLFDHAAAASRSGAASPLVDSMLSPIDGGDVAIDRVRDVFEKRGGEPDL